MLNLTTFFYKEGNKETTESEEERIWLEKISTFFFSFFLP